MIAHPIYRVLAFEVLGSYTLRIQFDDQSWQTIDFEPMLRGAMYGPLRNIELFNQVRIDPEVQTLVWPNGADFDPATLHDWPEHLSELRRLASTWEQRAAEQAHNTRHSIHTT